MNDISFDQDDTSDFFEIGDSNGKEHLKFKKSTKPKAKPKKKVSKFNTTSGGMPFTDRTFEDLSNPQKRMPERQPTMEESDDAGSESARSDYPDAGGDDGDQSAMSENGDTEDIPSAGFKTIEEEKQDFLYKFYRLEQRGMKLPKKFTMYSDVRDMRSEFAKIEKDIRVNASLKFSKKVLMAIVSASEFLNTRYDPFGFELDGWSESVMSNVNDGDYDTVMERLCEKYSGKMNTPPEIELMLALGGSAMMFHMTNTMFKGVKGETQGFDPAMAQKIFEQMNRQPQGQPQGQQGFNEDDGSKRTMKGPSIDLTQFGSMFSAPDNIGSSNMNMFPPPMESQVRNEPHTAMSVLSDSGSDLSLDTKDVIVNPTPKRRGRPKKTNVPQNSIIEI